MGREAWRAFSLWLALGQLGQRNFSGRNGNKRNNSNRTPGENIFKSFDVCSYSTTMSKKSMKS